MPGHLFPQDLQNSNLPSPMRSVKTHDPHLHTVYAREGIAAGPSARPFGSSAAPQELKKACTTALQETPRKLAPLLCKTVWHHSARKLVWLYFCKKKRAFLQGPKSKKILHKKTRIGFHKQGKFQASAMALRYCTSTEVGTVATPEKLDGQQPLVVKCFESWSEPLGK